MFQQKKKSIRLLLLNKEKKKKFPISFNFQERETNISKSWFNRSLRNNSSIRTFSEKIYNITKTHLPINIHNKSKTDNDSNLKKKYLQLFVREDPKKLKYLNNEILDTIFSKKQNNSFMNYSVTPRKNKLNLSTILTLKTKVKHWRNKISNSLFDNCNSIPFIKASRLSLSI